LLARLGRLSKDSLIYGVGGAVARYTSIFLLPIYTRAFSTTAEYGVLQSVSNFGALLLAITSLGLDGAAALLFFATDNPYERERICTLWVWLSALASLPLTLLLMAFADWVSLIATGSARYADLFRLGIAALPFSLLQVVFSNILRLTFRPRLYALFNFSLATLTALISIYLVVVAGIGPAGALWGTLIGTALVMFANGWVLRRTISVANIWGLHVLPTARRLLHLGMPLIPASVALWVISFSSTYFLIQIAGPAETGIFRVGAQLAALLGIGIWAFQLAWGPLSLSIAREPDAPRTYSRVATLYTAGAVGASVTLAALAPLLLRIFATGKYADAASVIGLLALATSALGAYYVVATGVNLVQRTGQIAWTTIVAAALNVALNALLIPIWGIVGAGLAALAANLTSTGLVYAMSQRYYPLPYRPLQLLTIWLSGSVCVILAALFNVVVQPPILISIGFTLILLAAYTVVLFIISAITMSELNVVWTALSTSILKPAATGLGKAWTAAAQRPLWPLVALVLLAFALRVAFMAAVGALNAPPTEDALEYHNLALNMLAGKGYTLDSTQIVNRAPAYPAFLALVYAIFGPQPAIARIFQALLISLVVPLLYYIGSRFWILDFGFWNKKHGDERDIVPKSKIQNLKSIGLLAAILFAIYPFSIFWSQYLITENLLVVLFAVLAALLVRPGEANPLRLLGAGVVMGLSLLTRPTALPVMILLFLWLLFAVKGARKITLSYAVLVVGLIVGLSPWVARNYAEYGQFIPFTSGYGSSAGGYVFWISNNALTAQPGEKWGRYVDPALLPENAEYNDPPNDPASMDRKGYRYGLNYLTSHPGDVPVLLLGKFLRFWNVFPGTALYTRAIGALSLLLLPFFLVGLWQAIRHPASGGLPLSFIIGTMLVGLIFWADTRTRVPAEPFILLLSALGVVWLVGRWARLET
jgi:O-antigen/teichoic acid export membrane protein